MYELWRFTGRFSSSPTLPTDVGEGSDLASSPPTKAHTSFRTSRGYKIIITFLATSLYLPLSKLAIGALSWTSDYWPVPNPYLAGVDNPVLVPLGDPSVFFDPGDFCWRTTMKRRDGLHNVNWAWVVLPVAAGTVIWLTLFLPCVAATWRSFIRRD